MKPCVIKIGGSILADGKPDVDYIKSISSMLEDLNKRMVIGVVVGAGKVGGVYVNAARKLKINQYQQDSLAIDVTRVNARLLANALPSALHSIPRTVGDARALMEASPKRIVVMGGTFPGHTTNAVAALLAENTGAKLVNCTNVDAVYDKDPNKFKNARKFSKMSADKLVELAAKYDTREARGHFIIDLLAAKIIQRSKIETHVVNGRKLSEIKKAALGKKHNGTVIK